MPPSSGHLLVPLAMRLVRNAVKKTSDLLRARLADASRPAAGELQPVLARNTPRHPIHPAAFLRQSRGKGRWYTTHSTLNAAIRRFTSSARAAGVKYDRSTFPKSTISNAVAKFPGRAPFATTLRPNLTGGALPRSAGGYGIGSGRVGGARYFSHTPAASAEVISNVSASIRAFLLSGQKVQFDGVSPSTGEKRFKAVSPLKETAGRKLRSSPRATPGSTVEFQLSPTITALSPLKGFSRMTCEKQDTLNTDGLLDLLSADFARALKDLSAVLNDLKRLSALGDLPLSLSTTDRAIIRVHFPGCDAYTVERLCDEVGIQRGIIRQDKDFDASIGAEMALLFPFAPSQTPSEHESAYFPKPAPVEWRTMLSPEQRTLTSPGFSKQSDTGSELEYEDIGGNPWTLEQSPISGYSSLHSSEMEDTHADAGVFFDQSSSRTEIEKYEGVEGIWRFLEQCDSARK